jgi:DNA-binding transcriptional ArsR family regulator
MPNRDQTMLSARVASAIVSELLAGPVPRAELMRRTGVSNGTIGRAVSLLRQSGVVIDNSGAGGSVYSLRRPEGVRDRLAGALRLSLGDLIAAGGVSPAVGVGLLIEAGAL